VVEGSEVLLRLDGVRLARLEEIGRRLARALRPGDLVLLYGPLGAGKTTLVRTIAEELGVGDPVRSPSFTIANIYSGPIPVQHLDLYRLGQLAEEDALALEEYVRSDAVTIVEWPEAGSARLGTPQWIVRLDHETMKARSLQVEVVGDEPRQRWERTGADG
jgi:tRNA threonylcarbamoyladenosine biosynthesis protein TsaE